jgi:hypothetical protein
MRLLLIAAEPRQQQSDTPKVVVRPADSPHRLEFLQPGCIINVTWLQTRAPSRLGAITRQHSSIQNCELAMSQPSTNLTGTSSKVPASPLGRSTVRILSLSEDGVQGFANAGGASPLDANARHCRTGTRHSLRSTDPTSFRLSSLHQR